MSGYAEMDTDELFLCQHCGKFFYRQSIFETHLRWKHMRRSNDFMCDQCGRTFQKKYNLLKHLDNGYHGVSDSVRCAVCLFRAENRKIMAEHYKKFHKISLNESNKYFNSVPEFFLWKNEFERNTKSRYVKMSSSRRRKNGFERSTYFCHRDGNFVPKGKNLRHLKIKGSNKINAHCPAKIDVDIGEKIVIVTYISTHLGHDLDITRLNLDMEDRALIASKLALKVPFEKILEEINDSAKDNELKRVNFLTRKDLWNIVDTFKLNPKSVVYSKNRSRRKREIDRPKKEQKRKRAPYNVLSRDANSSIDSEVVDDPSKGVMDAGEMISLKQNNGENVILCPVLIKNENDEYIQEYAVVSDENEVDGETCLIINSDGELETISGHQVVYTEEGEMEICETRTEEVEDQLAVMTVIQSVDKTGEMSLSGEIGVDVYDSSLGESVFYLEEKSAEKTSDVYEIPAIEGESDLISEAGNDCNLVAKERRFEGVRSISEYTNTNCENDVVEEDIQPKLKKDLRACEDIYLKNSKIEETNNQSPILSVGEFDIKNEPEIEVTIENLEEEDVNEYVIISTSGEQLNECDLSTEDVIEENVGKECHRTLPIQTVFVGGIKNEEPSVKEENVGYCSADEEECVESGGPKWNEKRNRILNKLLNVHSLVNNEEQLNVFSKNISTLENVLKSLSKNDAPMPINTEISTVQIENDFNNLNQKDSVLPFT